MALLMGHERAGESYGFFFPKPLWAGGRSLAGECWKVYHRGMIVLCGINIR